MPEFDKEAARQYLRTFKRLVRSHQFHVLRTQKNTDVLVLLGLTKKLRKEVILSLTVLDYSYGPEHDHTKPGEVWIFGTTIRSTEFYIKLKIVEGEFEDQALCISFHPAERPLHYPFRKKSSKTT